MSPIVNGQMAYRCTLHCLIHRFNVSLKNSLTKMGNTTHSNSDIKRRVGIGLLRFSVGTLLYTAQNRSGFLTSRVHFDELKSNQIYHSCSHNQRDLVIVMV